jgi:hypothetical protein
MRTVEPIATEAVLSLGRHRAPQNETALALSLPSSFRDARLRSLLIVMPDSGTLIYVNSFLHTVNNGVRIRAVRKSISCRCMTEKNEERLLLPDGTEFNTWEQPCQFSKTHHVAQKHPHANDDNPGTEDLPFKTINAAALLAQPGERVLVHEGVYRECVRPARGGSGPTSMIAYEAADGENVVIKGSDTIDSAKWQTSPLRAKKQSVTVKIWMVPFEQSMFQGVNPFALINARGKPYGFWYPAYTLRRGLVFQDGRKLDQVHTAAELFEGPGRYWVEGEAENAEPAKGAKTNATPAKPPEQYILHVRPQNDARPLGSIFEITTREQVFAPETEYLGYIRVNGFIIEHAANPFPRPQKAALSASRGHHWIVEENTVRWVNTIGIDVGHQGGTPDRTNKKVVCGYNIVRKNTISDCGVCGIAASEGVENGRAALRNTIVEDNRITNTGWQSCEALMENAAIKLHVAENCVVRRNFICDTHQASGIWLDWQNVNSRVTQNVIINTGTVRAGIYIEATFAINAVDNNFIWDCHISRNPEFYPRKFGGFGVLSSEGRNLLVAHNLIAGCAGAGLMLGLGDPKRAVCGMPTLSCGHFVLANIILNCATPVVFPNAANVSDCNIYGGIGKRTAWRTERPKRKMALRDWRKALEFDVQSIVAGFTMEFDSLKGELHVSGEIRTPVPPKQRYITHDLLGKDRSAEKTAAGPFADLTNGCYHIYPQSGTTSRIGVKPVLHDK